MSVENQARRKRKKRDVRAAILATVGITGIIAITAVAPGALQILKVTKLDAKIRYRTKSVLSRLKTKGEIEFIERNGKKFVRLTTRGENILELSRQKMKLKESLSKRWDHRYRLVMFDIPEKRKKTRDSLRRQMSEIGFLRIQDSAWLYPHDCEELITLLKADLHIGKDVLYAVVEEIGNDAWIRRHFSLPPKD